MTTREAKAKAKATAKAKAKCGGFFAALRMTS
jgi:hypothetical protein